MSATVIGKLSTGVQRHAWWVGPQLAVAVVLGVVVGYWVSWLVYVTINSTGVWLYTDRYGSQRRRRQLWMKALAIPLLPVGLMGVHSPGGDTSPSEGVGGGSVDPNVRKEVARVTIVRGPQ